MTMPDLACEQAFNDWWQNVILPPGSHDVAREAFCSGWDAAREEQVSSPVPYAAANERERITKILREAGVKELESGEYFALIRGEVFMKAIRLIGEMEDGRS